MGAAVEHSVTFFELRGGLVFGELGFVVCLRGGWELGREVVTGLCFMCEGAGYR